jgi:hypothetical protein
LRRDGRRPVGHGGRRGRLAGQERSEHPTIGREKHMSTASAKSAPGPHEIANSEIEADEHHERDKPLIALGGTVRDDKHAAVVDGRRASPQEGAKN